MCVTCPILYTQQETKLSFKFRFSGLTTVQLPSISCYIEQYAMAHFVLLSLNEIPPVSHLGAVEGLFSSASHSVEAGQIP